MNSKLEAVGCHVFAGGFTIGAMKHADVKTQLEVHGLGERTAREVVGVDVVRCDAKDWPKLKGQVLYGNPRCTAFSSLTAGCAESSHGPGGEQTIDAVELCRYGAENGFEFVVWESVQQAFTKAWSFLDGLYREYFADKHYKIAHVLVNAASFGNPQLRKRYFFVAYKDCYKFNVELPDIADYRCTLRECLDSVESARSYDTYWASRRDEEWGPGAHPELTEDEKHVLPRLPNGWGLNALAQYDPEALTPAQLAKWQNKTSKLPFSLYSAYRLDVAKWAPVVHSGANKWVHPDFNRTLTVAELSAIMGWPEGVYPVGNDPSYQLGKGIVPAVGEWIMEQVSNSVSGVWQQDVSCKYYDDETGLVESVTPRDQPHKVCDVGSCYPRYPDWDRVPCLVPTYPVDPMWKLPKKLDNLNRR